GAGRKTGRESGFFDGRATGSGGCRRRAGRSGFRQAKDLTSVVMMRRVPAALALCWTGLLGACGGSSPKAEEPNGSRPMTREELQQQFLREADPIQKHPVKGGRAWRAY